MILAKMCFDVFDIDAHEMSGYWKSQRTMQNPQNAKGEKRG